MKMSNRETIRALNTEISNIATIANSIDMRAGEAFGGSKFGGELSNLKTSIRTLALKFQEEVEQIRAVCSKDMQLLYIGHYPPYRNSDGSIALDAVACEYDPFETNTRIVNYRLTARGENMAEVMELKPFDIITGKFDFNPRTFKNGYEISSVFVPFNEDFPSYKERMETILGLHPIISIAEHRDNNSRYEGKEDYTDILDIKHLKCVISTYSEGYENVTMTVADSSTPVSEVTRPITVIVPSDIAEKADCGEGSFVHMLGHVSHNNAKYTEFTACAIIPIKRVSMKKSNVKSFNFIRDVPKSEYPEKTE